MTEKETKSCSKGCEEMTDNEVIKALEVCAYSDDCLKECPFFNYKADCTKRLTASALEIIKRHQSNVAPVKHGHIVWKEYHKGGIRRRKCLQEIKSVYIEQQMPCKHIAIIDERYLSKDPYCSECGKLLGEFLNYCGNCGAKMGGQGE